MKICLVLFESYINKNIFAFVDPNFSPKATIDACRKGAISRFINHSCEPNAETQKWTVNGVIRIGFFAIRDIEPEEEITFDYQFIHFGLGQTCLCGTASCSGVIGRKAGIDEYRRKAGLTNIIDENASKKILSKLNLYFVFKIH